MAHCGPAANTPERRSKEGRKEGRKEEERMGSSEGGDKGLEKLFFNRKKEGWCLEEEKGGGAMRCSVELAKQLLPVCLLNTTDAAEELSPV